MKPTFSVNDNYETTLEKMKILLAGLVAEEDLPTKAELVVEINKLKKEKNAVILGHNYMEPALFHTVADITGDSLELCRKAAKTDADTIIFCGVEFMAESAKILNPTKKVLIPTEKAGCSLAESITAEDVRKLKKKYPGVPVVTYINTYADVKAETDVCCTSSNAVKVVESLDSDSVIFLPDKYLGGNVARETGKTLIMPDTHDGSKVSNSIISWDGMCVVHDLFTVEDIEQVRGQHPDVVVLAHPECPPKVVEAADVSGSTSAMTKYVAENDAPCYLLLTECAMGDNIIAEYRDKNILRMCQHRCEYMKMITLGDTYGALMHDRFEVNVSEEIRVKAKISIDRMLEI